MEESQQDWLSIFKQWEQAGLSQKDFSKAQGLKYSQFYRARIDFLKQGVVQSCRPAGLQKRLATAFLPIGTSSAAAKTPSMIEIKLPHGILLRIPTDAAA